jgi:hypothetical protein
MLAVGSRSDVDLFHFCAVLCGGFFVTRLIQITTGHARDDILHFYLESAPPSDGRWSIWIDLVQSGYSFSVSCKRWSFCRLFAAGNWWTSIWPGICSCRVNDIIAKATPIAMHCTLFSTNSIQSILNLAVLKKVRIFLTPPRIKRDSVLANLSLIAMLTNAWNVQYTLATQASAPFYRIYIWTRKMVQNFVY